MATTRREFFGQVAAAGQLQVLQLRQPGQRRQTLPANLPILRQIQYSQPRELADVSQALIRQPVALLHFQRFQSRGVHQLGDVRVLQG